MQISSFALAEKKDAGGQKDYCRQRKHIFTVKKYAVPLFVSRFQGLRNLDKLNSVREDRAMKSNWIIVLRLLLVCPGWLYRNCMPCKPSLTIKFCYCFWVFQREPKAVRSSAQTLKTLLLFPIASTYDLPRLAFQLCTKSRRSQNFSRKYSLFILSCLHTNQAVTLQQSQLKKAKV